MKKAVSAWLCGIVFGFGLSLAQMTNPNKVLAFLDPAGSWDPSLAFVMAGALLVAFVAFRMIFERPAPLFDERFHVAKNTVLDKKLVIGALIFGVGWGMTGYCPGPAVAGLGSGNPEAWLVVPSIYAGFIVQRYFFGKKQ